MSDCVTHISKSYGPYLYPVCNDIPRDIPERDLPRMYVRTYVLYENRSPIQSLALMRSAIKYIFTGPSGTEPIQWMKEPIACAKQPIT